MEKGDLVKIYFEDKEYDYVVETKKVVESSAIQFLTYEAKKETLTLMTCWPPGTSLKRLVIQATPK